MAIHLKMPAEEAGSIVLVSALLPLKRRCPSIEGSSR